MIFIKKHTYSNITIRLFQILNEDHSLQGIIDFASEVFYDNLAFAMDSSGTIICKSSCLNVHDKIILEQVRDGFLSGDPLKEFKNDGVLNKLQENSSAFISIPDKGLSGITVNSYGWLYAPILVHGITVGIFGVAGNLNPFPEEYSSFSELFCHALSVELQMSNWFIPSHGVEYEWLLNDILEGKATDYSTIKKRFDSIEMPLPETAAIIVLHKRGQDEFADNVMHSVKQASLRHYFPGCMSLVYKHDVVLLVKETSKKSIKKGLLSDLEIFLKGNDLIAGISNVFSDLPSMNEYYLQASSAIRFGTALQPSECLYYYKDFCLFDLIEKKNNTLALSSLCIPELYACYKSGDPGDKVALESLFAYVNHIKSPIQAAEMLHIHKNTLYYRINKLAEDAELDLNNMDDIFKIQLTEKIFLYLDKL